MDSRRAHGAQSIFAQLGRPVAPSSECCSTDRVCTVEAMPMKREVDFLAVDEIQLYGHGERGHVFTDRPLLASTPQKEAVA